MVVPAFKPPKESGKKVLAPSPQKNRPMELCNTQNSSTSEGEWSVEMETVPPVFDNLPYGTASKR